MYLVQNITADPLQNQTLILDDGTSISLTLYYMPQQYGWFIYSMVYQGFTLQGFRIINSPNMLYQYGNQIPFGLACYTQGNREPTQLEDFSSSASTMYILTAAEVEQYQSLIENYNG